MEEILLTRVLRERGFGPDEVSRLQRAGALARVRRGAYAVAAGSDATVEQQHRSLVMATAPQLQQGAVISHGSAAVLHGLPVWPTAVRQVHVTRDRSYGGKKRNLVHVHGAPLLAGAVTVSGGILVTSVARTVLDLGRTLPFEQAVAAGDRALALGLTPAQLEQTALAMERWPGIRQARRVNAFVDARSESVGESVSRARFRDDGLPPPTLQREIFDVLGKLVARSDFCWEEHKTLGEFDGRIKYGRLLKPGQAAEEVVFAEKCREDVLRDLGWQVVRWLWADLYRPGVIRERLMRAFARAR